MIKLIKILSTLYAIFIIIGCSNTLSEYPDYWEYSPNKWLAFNQRIGLYWNYHEPIGVKFEISQLKMDLSDIDIEEIHEYIKKQKIDKLLEKERHLRKKLNFAELVECGKPTQNMYYIDNQNPIAFSGKMYIYQVRAMKDHKTSLPSELSIIFLDRSSK